MLIPKNANDHKNYLKIYSKQADFHGSDQSEINYFFGNIASDPIYSRDFVMPSHGPGSRSAVTCTTVEIEKVLSRVRRTWPGNDDIPYWVFRDCAPELVDVTTKIIKISVGLGVVMYCM